MSGQPTPSAAGIAGHTHPRNRRLTLDKLTSGEIYARIDSLPNANTRSITAKLRQIDAEIIEAQKTLQHLMADRSEELRNIDIDLADWKPAQLRRAGLRRTAQPRAALKLATEGQG